MLVYIVTLSAITYVQAKIRLDPLVDTGPGLIKGLNDEDGHYSMFLGVPYAKVNRSNPFGDAIPITNFDEVFEAYEDSTMCPQVEDVNKTISGSLDCLRINIYVPNIASKQTPVPVLIWIHGGFLMYGYNSRYVYGPKFLVNHNVILVTINYRVGPYGFMCLDIPEIPGNQGLKDQYLAIKWVRENIIHFGGDPSKITVMGESAGSKCVEAHLITKRTNLFNKAIMQSGSVLGSKIVELPDKEALVKIAQQLGFETDDNIKALNFLSGFETESIIKASTELGQNFQICVEKEFENVERFVSEHPEHSDYATTKNLPILIGFNNKELMAEIKNPEGLEDPNYIKDNLKFLFDLQGSEEMVDILRQFYIGDKTGVEMKSELIDFISDFTYNYPVQRSIEKYLKNNANVFQYLFSYDGQRNYVKKKNNLTMAGAAHADEIAYLFDVSYENEITSNDQLTVDRMTKLWTNFVKYGNPTPETSELLPIKWEQTTIEKMYYMNIGTDLSLGTRPFHERLIFWDLFFKINKDRLKANLDIWN